MIRNSFLVYIFDPPPQCVFLVTLERTPTPHPCCDVTFFILKNTSFLRLYTVQNRALLFKKGQNISRDTLVYPLPPPCVIV